MTAKRSLISNHTPKRRTSYEVMLDKRFSLKYTTNEYLSVYFLIPFDVLVESNERFKDVIMHCILEREKGNLMYKSLFVPENNVVSK